MDGHNWFDVFMMCYIGLALVLIVAHMIICVHEKHKNQGE